MGSRGEEGEVWGGGANDRNNKLAKNVALKRVGLSGPWPFFLILSQKNVLARVALGLSGTGLSQPLSRM